MVLQVGGMQLQQILAGEWLRQVEAEYFGAKGTLERANVQPRFRAGCDMFSSA
ncbi:hypothetical protein GCM10007386_31880 [Pseudoduganella dura]|nr:hypothetical protein GCM10007386_31880 [Pseudoduganella dura]